jgi:hypothetical protein
MCFIEKFVRGPFSRGGLRIVATFARGAGFIGREVFGGDEGGDLRAVENLDDGIGEEGFGCTGEAANSALGVMGIVSNWVSPSEMSIGVNTRPGIFGDCSGTWLMEGGASDRWDGSELYAGCPGTNAGRCLPGKR